MNNFYHKLTSISGLLFFGWILLDIVGHLPDNHYGGFGIDYYITLTGLFVLYVIDCFIMKKINWLRFVNFILTLILLLISNPFNINVTYGTWISRRMPQWGVYVPKIEWSSDWEKILAEEKQGDMVLKQRKVWQKYVRKRPLLRDFQDCINKNTKGLYGENSSETFLFVTTGIQSDEIFQNEVASILEKTVPNAYDDIVNAKGKEDLLAQQQIQSVFLDAASKTETFKLLEKLVDESMFHFSPIPYSIEDFEIIKTRKGRMIFSCKLKIFCKRWNVD